MDNLFNERFNLISKTLKREYYPRHLKNRGGLSREFIDMYEREKQKLILGGVSPKSVHAMIVKALKFHN